MLPEKPVIHIWFNGDGVEIPANNDWEKFVAVDELRTFLICAESWQRAGWDVRRLTTTPYDYPVTPFQSTGRCAEQMYWYKPEYWQFVAKAKAVASAGINWFCSYDVLNINFTPEYIPPLDIPVSGSVFYNFQQEHFSLSLWGATKLWIERAEGILVGYDQRQLPEIRASYISDERILREYGIHAGEIQNFACQKFACNPGDEPLIHFSRSTLGRMYKAIPLSRHAD